MVRLWARLGVRAGDVAARTLEARAWDAGDLRVRGTGARRARLPRPPEVGAACGAPRRHGRPPGATRPVLVRRRAPRRGFGTGQRSEEHTSELQSQSNLVCR